MEPCEENYVNQIRIFFCYFKTFMDIYQINPPKKQSLFRRCNIFVLLCRRKTFFFFGKFVDNKQTKRKFIRVNLTDWLVMSYDI